MDFGEFLYPYQPYKDEVDTLRALFREAAPEKTVRQFTPVFQDLFLAHSHQAHSAEVVWGFLDQLEQLGSMGPIQVELREAPKLDRWCAVFYNDAPILLGYVIGHPLLRAGARARTSPLFRTNADRTWARTWSRFYELREYVPATLYECQADGVIPDHVQLIRFE